MNMSSPVPERRDWQRHWRELSDERSFFGTLASVVRKVLLSRAVRRYSDRFFARHGWFLEAGCGTAESSGRIRRHGRKLIGLDFSLAVLSHARRQGTFDSLVCADVRRLPFRDAVFSGLWNLGVMEHFHPPQARSILQEFRRILRPGIGTLVLFWPPTFGLSRFVLAPFEWLRSRLGGRQFQFFPDEVNRLPTRLAARRALEEAELEYMRADFTPRDGFNHLVVVGRRADG